MRTTSLTFSIAASLLLLGFAGQARADLSCAQRNLPDFSRDLNRNAAWNAYITTQLTNPANQWPGLTQLKAGFGTQQCATAWAGSVGIGVTQRSCTFDAPTPVVVNGTEVHYQATSTNNAILKLRGCGGVVRLPSPVERVQ